VRFVGRWVVSLGLLIAACGGSESAPSGPPEGTPVVPGPPAPSPEPTAPSTTEPPATPPLCARKDQARTAPAALFDAFQKDVATLSGADKDARVTTLLADVAAQGGTPLRDPSTGRVIFLARGAPPAGPWSAVGSFAGWDKTKGISLTNIAGTDLYAGEATILPGTSHTYKLLSGTSDAGFMQDPLARNVVWDGFNTGTVGEFNAYVHPEAIPADKGRIVRHPRLHAQKLANDRDVFTYLPARYDDAACPKLPVVVFHDGNEALTRGDFAGEADKLYAARPELAAVLVFVALPTQNVRMAEYTFGTVDAKGSDYVDFVVSDLLPLVSKGYRLCSQPAAKGISGASLGGLISTYAAFESPSTFGWVGAQSSSYFWENDALVTRVETSAKIPVRFYLDSGAPNGVCDGGDNCAITDEMEQVMKTKGYDVLRVKAMNAAHDWPFWRDRFAGMLTHFRDKQIACD
jgi:iron(III)-enterobactin esterase